MVKCMPSILLINVKMSKIVGILTFISRINPAALIFQARKIFFSESELLGVVEIACSVERSMKNKIQPQG